MTVFLRKMVRKTVIDRTPILFELMALCHWLWSMTWNLWTFVIDCSQWQKFMAKPAKKCHWLRSMTKKSVIDWMYTIYGQSPTLKILSTTQLKSNYVMHVMEFLSITIVFATCIIQHMTNFDIFQSSFCNLSALVL